MCARARKGLGTREIPGLEFVAMANPLSRHTRSAVLLCCSLWVVATSCIGGSQPSPAVAVAGGSTECVQAPSTEVVAWRDQVDRRIDNALADIAQCSLRLPPSEAISLLLHLDFDRDGNSIGQQVLRGSSQACVVKQCIENKLARLQAPAPPSGAETAHNVALRLEAGSMRRVEMTAEPAPPFDPACRESMHQGLASREIEMVLRTQDSELKKCETAARARSRILQGNVLVEFTVGEDGLVHDARASSATLRDCILVACLVEGHGPMRFPVSNAGSSHVVAHIFYRH